MQAGRPLLSCQFCGESFSRREHRDRHELRHSGAKPFQCQICFKSFSRNDTLLRHKSLHRFEGEKAGPIRRCAQACLPCAKLKQRCEGGLPCTRCEQKQVDCRYEHGSSSNATIVTPPTDDNKAPKTDSGVNSPFSQVDEVNLLNKQSTQRSPIATEASDCHNQITDQGATQSFSQDWSSVFNTLSGSCVNDTIASESPTLSSLDQDITWTGGLASDTSFPFAGSEMPDDFSGRWKFATNFPFLSTLSDLESQMRPPNSLGVPDLQFLACIPHPTSQEIVAPHNVNEEGTQPQAYDERQIHRYNNVRPTQTKQPCLEFPSTQGADFQSMGAEIFGHIRNLPAASIDALERFYMVHRLDTPSRFIPKCILHAFIDLYFEYFDPQFPFVHVSRLEIEELPWILLLATAAIGSQYSEIEHARDHGGILFELLRRAIDAEVLVDAGEINISVIQSIFLHHIYLMFSESMRDKRFLQHRRNMLVALCRDLVIRRNFRSTSHFEDHGLNHEWLTWLRTEEINRLVCCIHALECLGLVFVDNTPLFNLPDFLQKLPCPGHLWQCRDAQAWRRKYKELSEERNRSSTSTQSPETLPESERFLCKISLLELYADEINLQHQLQSSYRLRSSFASYLTSLRQTNTQRSMDRQIGDSDNIKSKNHSLDVSIESYVFQVHQMSYVKGNYREETLVHVLAILRHVSLKTLYSATGWQTDKDHMENSRSRLRAFFRTSGPTARQCLWHAACIFRSTRTTQRLACYDTLSLCIATCYIWSYDQLRSAAMVLTTLTETPQPVIRRGRIIRLDQLCEKQEVEHWVSSGADADIHLTGVGILDSSKYCIRLLSAVEKILLSQIAWRGLCVALAQAFVQLGRGETPTVHVDDCGGADTGITDKE